ncbi:MULTISPECIES: P-loop NTPase fold protein [unclassified Exiguobacterium]|uniref:KAP family P-loop NTPase fold protein n=1 Tax=unclassified Exiguobacterium TaxID=2644629 RepID=UPI00103BCB58|nr:MULTISPECIES: P-loop NTPase fold protein [unclassified Exiguobacterium]TCI43087.1 NTPase [Exiguobacterium sp. SH5S32]TCI49873.1 NTPase [Exiguobacterium sp. SH1S4]TCI68108.1 NTPase [Exiguobacterium sp. SH1S1]
MVDLNYSSDNPIDNPSHDKFNRYPFAQRVANVIAERNDSSSIVIGIYGAWGEGKTSVFNFIENELKDKPDIVCMNFNPWRFGSEDQMLVNFFNDLATSIDRTIETGREKIGDFIEKYVKPIASIAGRTEAAEGIGSFFSGADIEELKSRIESLLENEKKRVVIFIDDIDRLEKNDIHALFRLVKLTADFKYTAYILAFDKEVVATVLQERYGPSSSLGAGNSFLEKIIQVPLHLPAVDKEDLRTLCFNEINKVIDFVGVGLSEENAREFVNNFSKGIEPQLTTPRQAKLYSNILMFSLPILRNEANIVDLMLIEGVRVFLPEVYSLIKNNKELFLTDGNMIYSSQQKEKEKVRKKEKIEGILARFHPEEKENILDLLCFLFPKLNAIFKNTTYGNDWEETWSEKQRICSPLYFQRYFTYAINKKDISDITINELLERSKDSSIAEIVNEIKEIMNENNAETFISKLRRLSKSLTSEQLKNLALSISKLGNYLPNPVQVFSAWNTYGQGAMFTADCVVNLEDKTERLDLGRNIILTADPLAFAAECFSWFRKNTEEHPNPNAYSEEEYLELAKTLAQRASEEITKADIGDLGKIERLPYLLTIWHEYGETGEASQTISQNIVNDSDFVFDLLESYTPTAFGEFGSKKSNFSNENYDAVKKIVNPDLMVDTIQRTIGNLPFDENYPNSLNVSRKEELARQFLWIHHFVNDKEKDT